jgi:hypothetical protein
MIPRQCPRCGQTITCPSCRQCPTCGTVLDGRGIGLGDLVQNITHSVGLKTCGGCENRRKFMNQVQLPTKKRRERI